MDIERQKRLREYEEQNEGPEIRDFVRAIFYGILASALIYGSIGLLGWLGMNR